MTFFSIVIPVWNAAQTLADTLETVKAQTFQDYDVIIMDDGSTDESAAIAEQFVSRDNRFKLVSVPNGGPSKARNDGVFQYAQGRFIAFLDSDDLWEPDKLARCADVLLAENAPQVLYAKIAFFRGEPNNIETVSTVLPHALTPKDLLRENAVCTTSNIVVSTDVFKDSGGFDLAIVHGEDVEWLIRLAASGVRIEAIDDVLVYYRASNAGLSANLDAMQTGWQKAVETALKMGCVLSPLELAAAEAIHLRYLARRALRVRTKRGTALRLSLKAIARSPTAFFASPRRSLLTLGAALVESLSPSFSRYMKSR